MKKAWSDIPLAMSVSEVAEFLNISPATVRKLIRLGDLSTVVVEKKSRVSKASLYKFIKFPSNRSSR